MNEFDLLEQKILSSSVRVLGSDRAEEVYYRFHVMYQEKHNKELLQSGHDLVLMGVMRKYYERRSKTYARYMKLNFGVVPNLPVENTDDWVVERLRVSREDEQ